MRSLVFRPSARTEIAEAVDWYERQGIGLGAEFLRALEVTMSSIHHNPKQYQRIHGRMWRAVLRRFPYSILYFSSSEEIVVVGCIHARRDPKRWQERTPR
jgi:plasmid stabilization system protein ParE